MSLELNKSFENICFAFQQLYPSKFTKIIDETNIVFEPPTEVWTGPQTSENISSRGERETLLEEGNGN